MTDIIMVTERPSDREIAMRLQPAVTAQTDHLFEIGVTNGVVEIEFVSLGANEDIEAKVTTSETSYRTEFYLKSSDPLGERVATFIGDEESQRRQFELFLNDPLGTVRHDLAAVLKREAIKQ